MDKGHELYCLTDPDFYDSPSLAQDEVVDFGLARSQVPEGWQRFTLDDWLVYKPRDLMLPSQGWKIHASACLDNAEEILTATWEYCITRGIAFKFIRSVQHLFLRNRKYASRGSSGKFITIYPADEGQLELVLTELGELLDEQPGPYILSDLRWGKGPLYVRYGGFAERYCLGSNGELEFAIEDGSGQLVPDERSSTFQVPPWLTLPGCLVPHLEARNSTTVADLPYGIQSALHFSNGGGLYEAVDTRTDERVVLKEARPHAGLAPDRSDAVTRLGRERAMLEQLAGLGVVPELRDYFTLGDHHFLVQDFIEGETLNALLVERYPLVSPPEETAVAEYTAWALDMCERVERAVATAHERGVVLGDLHPSNVMVQPEGTIVLVDLEAASLVSEARGATVANPGFLGPAGQVGVEVDDYALACLRVFMFLPLTTLLMLDPLKAGQFAAVIAETFPVPRAFISGAAQTITAPWEASTLGPRRKRERAPKLDAGPNGWRRARDSMAEAILSSATPTRGDRLFPGDPKQFDPGGGLNLAYGAAGVLYALNATGAGRHPEHEEWLVQRATHPVQGMRLGFYDGLHGIAYALDRLDRRSDALKVLAICIDETGGVWERFGLDLTGGLAGMGLNLAYFAQETGDPALWDAAWRIADVVAARLGDENSVAEISGGEHPYAGLTRGSSGPALMFLRLYEHSGDSALLDLAATAIRQDLRRCVTQDDGSLQVNEGWRTLPYVADGSVGIAFVLDDYLAYRDDEDFAESVAAIRRITEARFVLESGLFYGRAGMILYRGRERVGEMAEPDPVVAAHVRDLAWHAVAYRGHLAFPGEYLMRLSMDLASGTAGVMLALGSALHDEPVHLPFLGPIRASDPPQLVNDLVTMERR
ncbi:MAG: class III lanthionine synthetase LanKC [Actinomycetota bacterium]|nr:class III lanthionine synthetase LanKC [Actinomycetota bacterium]